MPAVSDKQERFMRAVANNPKFAKQVGVPQSVGKEFTKSKGGQMKTEMKKVAKQAVKGHEARMHGKKMAEGGKATKKPESMMDKLTKYSPAGMVGKVGRKAAEAGAKMAKKTVEKKARGGGVEMKGKTKGRMVKMAMGGSVSKRADGAAKRGKTSCKMV